MRKPLKKTTTKNRLNTIRRAAKAELKKGPDGAFGFYATDIRRGVKGLQAYDVIGDWCKENYGHRPGQSVLTGIVKDAQKYERNKRAKLLSEERRVSREQKPTKQLEEMELVLVTAKEKALLTYLRNVS